MIRCHHPNQVIKFSITNNAADWHEALPDGLKCQIPELDTWSVPAKNNSQECRPHLRFIGNCKSSGNKWNDPTRKQSDESRMQDTKISLLYSHHEKKKIKGFREEGALPSHRKTKAACPWNECPGSESNCGKTSSRMFWKTEKVFTLSGRHWIWGSHCWFQPMIVVFW